MRLEDILKSGAPELGVPLSENAEAGFRAYYELLMLRNKEFNLTAIKGEEEAARLHFLDCLGLLKVRDFKNRRVVDVGSGGGFPGWPIKIAEPSVNITLVDSTEKKVNFLREVSEKLDLPAECVHARAEELSTGEKRESYDIAVSRAVARLNILSELCLPLVKVGGAFISMKAADSDAEIAEAARAARLLGGGEPEVREYGIPGTDIIRRAVIIEKLEPTPKKYPRRYGAIKKAPL